MKETEILRGLGKAREATKQAGNGVNKSPLQSLRRGTASLQGPGTTKSDSIPANLSKNEAVLPAKTVQALGPQNIAALIQQTTGKAPQAGLRAGGHYMDGTTPTNVPGVETGPATMQDFTNAKAGVNPNYRQASNATLGADQKFTQPKPSSFGDAASGAQTQVPSSGAAPQPSPTPSAPTPEAPPQPGLRGMASRAWNGAKNFATNTVPEAAEGAVNGIKGAPATVAGKALSGITTAAKWAGVPLEAASTARDYATPGMTDQQKSDRLWEGAGRVAGGLGGAAVGANMGAVVGSVVPGLGTALGAGVGGLAGGVIGAAEPELAQSIYNKVNGKNDLVPSQVASNLRAAQQKTQAQTAQPDATQIAPQAPTGDPAGAGRGNVNPAYVNGATEAQYPSQNSILKTVGPDGKVTYSGQNIKSDGLTMHGADGRATGLRGSVQTVNGAPTFGPNGSYVVSADNQPQNLRAAMAGPNGQQMTPQDVAVMQANQRDGIGLYKGTSQDPDLQGGQSGGQGGVSGGMRALLMQRAQANLKNFGVMGNHTMAMLQDMDRTDIDRQRVNNEAKYQQGELGARRDAIDKDYAVANMNNERERMRLSSELGQQGEKGFNEDNMNSPFATAFDKEKKQDVKSQAEADNLGQFLKSNSGQYTANGKPVNLPMLRATNPDAYNQLRSNAEAMYGLGKKANDYAGTTLFGQSSGWAGPKISDVRDMDLGDFPKGSSFVDSLSSQIKMGAYRKGVVLDVGGRKQVVPIGELINDPKNGGQYRQVINNWLAKNKRPILGDSLTGE